MKNNVACIHRGHAKPFSVVINLNLFSKRFTQFNSIVICYNMEALSGHVVKFSLRHILKVLADRFRNMTTLVSNSEVSEKSQ